jgi:hypothetical protein
MNATDFTAMERSLRAAIEKYPHCPIANCRCQSFSGQWKIGCLCMCHFRHMDKLFGEGKWELADVIEQAKKGARI